MYTCEFFNRDINRVGGAPQLLSAYYVTTDISYSYKVTQDDIMFYPSNTYCLIVVLFGSMQFNTKRKVFTVSEGQNIILSFNEIVSYKSKSQTLKYAFFNFSETSKIDKLGQILNCSADKFLLDTLMQAANNNQPNTILDSIFTTLKYIVTSAKTQQKSELKIEPCELIRQKMYFKLSNKDISDYYKISPRALTDMFKKLYNTTPQSYLLKVKIEHAMLLLSTTNTPISEIAYLLSFNSPFHFSNRFKQFCNLSPTQYRRQFIK